MTRQRRRTEAFTLVELLVVIAIIGILTGLTAVALPRALESAKLAKLDNTFRQLQISLTEYFVDHGTFPPAYGYLDRKAMEFVESEVGLIIRDLTFSDIDQIQTTNAFSLNKPVRVAYTRPWMAFLEQHSNNDLYDLFSLEYDTDRDGDISRLEYSPLGRLTDAGSGRYNFTTALYNPNRSSGADVDERDGQLRSRENRPLLYFPINKRQFRKLKSDWYKKAASGSDPRPIYSENNPSGQDVLNSMSFPPPNYDAYVLMSVGPSANMWKMITDFADIDDQSVLNRLDPDNYAPIYYYHILGMAAYFMATRDAEVRGEGDDELDFDFKARTRRGQAASENNKLPDVEGRRAAGPVIFVGEG